MSDTKLANKCADYAARLDFKRSTSMKCDDFYVLEEASAVLREAATVLTAPSASPGEKEELHSVMRKNDLNRRVEVEEILLAVAANKRDLLTREECRQLAMRLGVPEIWKQSQLKPASDDSARLGEVTEEQVERALNARVPGGAQVKDWLPTVDSLGAVPHDTAKAVIRAALETLQAARIEHGEAAFSTKDTGFGKPNK